MSAPQDLGTVLRKLLLAPTSEQGLIQHNRKLNKVKCLPTAAHIFVKLAHTFPPPFCAYAKFINETPAQYYKMLHTRHTHFAKLIAVFIHLFCMHILEYWIKIANGDAKMSVNLKKMCIKKIMHVRNFLSDNKMCIFFKRIYQKFQPFYFSIACDDKTGCNGTALMNKPADRLLCTTSEMFFFKLLF